MLVPNQVRRGDGRRLNVVLRGRAPQARIHLKVHAGCKILSELQVQVRRLGDL